MNYTSIESEKNSRFARNINEISSSHDGGTFIAESVGDISYINLLIEMTGTYPTLESWNAIKVAIDEGEPNLFTITDGIKLIHNANSIFPNQDNQWSFIILSVVSHCVSEMLENPFDSLIHDQPFLDFFTKLPICFAPDSEHRVILTAIDIIETIASTYDPLIENIDIIKATFYQIQSNAIKLANFGSFSDYVIVQILSLIDKLFFITANEENLPILLSLFAGILGQDNISEEIQSQSIKAIYHLTKLFPTLYASIIESGDLLNCIISLLSEEYQSLKYAAKILLPLLSQVDTCKILLDLNVGNDLLQAFMKLFGTKNTNSIILLEDITAICEISQIGCAFYINSGLLNQPAIIDASFKLALFFLRIIYASMTFEILSFKKIPIEILINVIEKSLESEDSMILKKTLKIIYIITKQGINIIENVRSQLEELSFGDWDEEISNEATLILRLNAESK